MVGFTVRNIDTLKFVCAIGWMLILIEILNKIHLKSLIFEWKKYIIGFMIGMIYPFSLVLLPIIPNSINKYLSSLYYYSLAYMTCIIF